MPDKKVKRNAGMSYAELIVVLSIFAVLSSVAFFNYGDFQAKVDMKNLAGDVASKIVEAQKTSLSGLLPSKAITTAWKPSYGIYFSRKNDGTPDSHGADYKNFIYFADIDSSVPQNGLFEGSNCTQECLSPVTITKGNYISDIIVVAGATTHPTNLAITFARPSSSAIIASDGAVIGGVSYIQIVVRSPKGIFSTIEVSPAGRVWIK